MRSSMFSQRETTGTQAMGMEGIAEEEDIDDEETGEIDLQYLHHQLSLKHALYSAVENSETWKLLKHAHATMIFSKWELIAHFFTCF